VSFEMVGLPQTVSEICGIKVRPLTSSISGMAEPIEFNFRRSLGYVDLYELPWSVSHISKTVQVDSIRNEVYFSLFAKYG
jgi:hypothetical protein